VNGSFEDTFSMVWLMGHRGDRDPLKIYEKFLACNLYKCIMRYNNTLTSTYERIVLAYEKSGVDIQNISQDTIITYAGDFGLKEMGPKRGRWRGYELSGAGMGSFLAVDVESILEKFDHWFTPNLEKKIHDRIYPLPLGIYTPNYARTLAKTTSELQAIPKTELCYANFSMTVNYRILVAEWAHQQPYINCHFPKRLQTQGQQLEMDILSDEPLSQDTLLQTLASHQFAICPIGNGLDTHRMWECILTNTVPIAQDNYANRIFSKIWPMILVRRYERCNILTMMEEFEKIHGDEIQYDHGLLLKQNLPELMERIKYECQRS